MAKKHGTHQILRGEERFAHELVQRKFPEAQVDVQDFQNAVTMGGGDLIIYSGEFALLFRNGNRWSVIQHGFLNPTEDQIRGLHRSMSDAPQEPPMDGITGPLAVGGL